MTEPRRYTLELLPGLPLLNANDRKHWRTRSNLTRDLRNTAYAIAKNARIPHLERVHITGWYHPPRNGRRDPANWYPSFKACIDGLVDAGVLDDDDHTRVTGPDMRLGHVVPGSQLVLEIVEVLP